MRPLLAAIILYVGAYGVFRQSHIEVRESDGQPYVIFPQGYGVALYCAWRSLILVDAATTGMRFHICPHR